MNISNKRIDKGAPFDFGRTSADYAKFRDIYPESFYKKILSLGIGKEGQQILDVGTGTGVLPRNMRKFGAKWTGTDISENQIEAAKKLSEETDILNNQNKIEYFVRPTENLGFDLNSFDAITACQCFWYFDYEKTALEFSRVLKPHGKILLLVMEWLPFESEIALASENLVLKYNPAWSGKGSVLKSIKVPQSFTEFFTLKQHEEWKLPVHFTRETWNGRMKSCRGIGASLPKEKIAQWEAEHLQMLKNNAAKEFDILHYAAYALLEKKD